MRIKEFIKDSFQDQKEIYWENLSHLTSLLIVLNLSMFFVTELVTKQGYFYTYYSLLCLGIVHIGLIVPFGLLHRLWYYLIFLAFESIAIYFFVVSVWYWVITNKA